MSITRRYTIADLEQMTPQNGERMELIDGELFVSRQPSSDHQYAADEIQAALRAWSHDSRLGMAFSAPGLVFDGQNAAAPDVIWMSLQRIADGRDSAGHFVIGPELVVEVLSPGSANGCRDRETKLALYSREGVDEYWIVDLHARHVEILTRQEGRLRVTTTLPTDGQLTSSLLPGFRLRVDRLWVPAWMPTLRSEDERA